MTIYERAKTDNVSIRDLELLIEDLKEVHAAASMERANFNNLGRPTSTIELTEASVNEFIKERTRLYRDSWIKGPLERQIKIFEGKLACKRGDS